MLYPVPVEIPFALGKGAINAPVDEDAELGIRKFLSGSQILFGRLVGLCQSRPGEPAQEKGCEIVF